MKCPCDGGEMQVLLDYVSGKSGGESRSAFERHMTECGECRKVAAAQEAVWAALSDWEEIPVSADFNRRLYARIDAEEQQQGWFLKWWRAFDARLAPLSWKPAIPAAAACAVLGVGLLLQTPTNMTKSAEGGAQARAEKVDVEQVEKTLDDIELIKQLGTLATDGDSSGS